MSLQLGDRSCAHCGTPFNPQREEDHFCCAGCAFVYDLIKEEGLEKFYDLKGNARLLPAGSSVLLPTETAWAEEIQAMAEAKTKSGVAETRLDLQGVSCVGCVWLLEALFRQQPGAGRIVINAQRGEAQLSWVVEEFSLPTFVKRAAAFGYQFGLPTHNKEAAPAHGLRLGLAGGLALNAMAFTLPRYLGMEESFALAGVFELIAAASATLSLLACGSYFITRAWGALRLGRLHLDVPISLGIIAAWIGSIIGWLAGQESLLYFDFVATFIFLMLLGRRWQEASVARHRARLLRAEPLMQQVRVETEAGQVSRQVIELRRRDIFTLPSGGVNPVSADLLEESASLSLEWISGEAEPRRWEAGGLIPPGAVNLGQTPLRLRARENWEESFLAKLSAPAKDDTDNPAVHRSERLLRAYLSVVVALAFIGGVRWTVEKEWVSGLQVFISVLVVSCPCALGVALPLAHELAVARLKQRGLFVRRADVWGRLRLVRQVVFDKTGTLTLETPQLQQPEALDGLRPAAREALAALVRESRHPLSQSLRQALAARGGLPALKTRAALEGASAPVEYPGDGVTWLAPDGALWSLGRAGWFPPQTSGEGRGEGPAADVVLRCDGVLVAAFSFTEAPRPDARCEIERLHRMGYHLAILSGDREEKVVAFAKRIGLPLDQVWARQSPEAKAAWLHEYAPRSLFIGDGANDSLAFDAALVRGTPAIERGLLTEKADFYFLSRGIQPVRDLLQTAQDHRRAVTMAFVFAVSYNAGVLSLALAGHMTPLLAAILMPLSSLITLLLVAVNLKEKIAVK